jgi:uncharacterized membrane protein
MTTDISPLALRLGDRPLYSLLVQFLVVCFVGTLATDLVYWRTQSLLWETFSIWLLAVGCLFAALSGIVGLIGFLGDRRLRLWKLAWPHALTSLLAAVLSVVSVFVHSRDGYTAVVPGGLALSVVVVLLMLLATWMGWSRAERAPRPGMTT